MTVTVTRTVSATADTVAAAEAQLTGTAPPSPPPPASPPPPPPPPASTTLLPGSGGSLTTSDGIWTFGTTLSGGGYNILLNGQSAGGGDATKLVSVSGTMYAFALGQWYRWAGGWATTSDPTVAPPSPPSPPSPPASPPPPAGSNVYPFIVPTTTPLNSVVELGAGPDVLHVKAHTMLADQPGQTLPPEQLCSVAFIFDGVPILVIPVLTAFSVNVHGSWGPGPHNLLIAPGNQGAGMKYYTMPELSYNYIPYGLDRPQYIDGPNANPWPAGATGIWDNAGIPLTFGPITVGPPIVIPPPPPIVAADPITNGQTLDQLVAATPAGGTLTLPAGTFHGAAVVGQSITIVGAGMGQTILNGGDGFAIPNQKGIFTLDGGTLTLTDMTLKNAIGDGNGAGVRMENTTANLVMQRVEVTGCPQGILASVQVPNTCTVAFSDCNFHDNGAGDGQTHEMYIGEVSEFTLTNTTVTGGMKSSHSVKSRAAKTTISGCTVKGSLDPGGNVAGAVVNVPEGGDLLVENTTIEITATGNPIWLQYADENQKQGVKPVTLNNVKLIDDTNGSANHGALVGHGGPLVIGPNCTWHGGPTPNLMNWSSVTGAFTPA